MKKMFTRFIVAAVMLAIPAASFGQTYTIGADAGYNGNQTYPTPFGDWYKTQRMQFLYLASELTAAGMVAGDITEVAWNVILLDPTVDVTEGYTLKMMATGTSSLGLDTWEEGAGIVWGPMDYTPVLGTNTFVLDAPFAWDGVSNVLIEICGGSSLGIYTYNGQVTWSGPLAFNGSRTYRSDVELAPCTYSGTTYSDYTPGGPDYRPQVIFTSEADMLCEGAPVVGAAMASMESVCPDDLFDVWIDPVGVGGISYQWASSTDGIEWTDIVGATTASYGTTQSMATWYRVTVTCVESGESDVSDAVYVGQNEALECYCQPIYVTGTSDGDFISNVSLGAINNTTEGSGDPYYNYYDGMSTDLAPGEEYTISITTGSYENFNGVAAWIDYNADGAFDEVTEKLGEVTGLGAYTAGEITFTVPMDAVIGNTRLRTREVYNTIGIMACELYTYGETEDYNVNMTPVMCPVPTGLYVDGITATSSTIHWELIEGVTQYRVALWNNATGDLGRKSLTSGTYTLSNLTPMTTYAFRVKSVCYDAGVITDYTEWYYWTTLGKLGDANSTVSLYPNPNNGTFTLQVGGYENNTFDLMVYDAMGRMVYSKTVEISNDNFTEAISLDNVSAGMYQVKLVNSEYQLSYPVMIQR